LQNEPESEDRAEDQGFSITDNAILDTLEIMLFASIRQVAKMTFLPSSYNSISPFDEMQL
jgi:hypothetical protein